MGRVPRASCSGDRQGGCPLSGAQQLPPPSLLAAIPNSCGPPTPPSSRRRGRPAPAQHAIRRIPGSVEVLDVSAGRDERGELGLQTLAAGPVGDNPLPHPTVTLKQTAHEVHDDIQRAFELSTIGTSRLTNADRNPAIPAATSWSTESPGATRRMRYRSPFGAETTRTRCANLASGPLAFVGDGCALDSALIPGVARRPLVLATHGPSLAASAVRPTQDEATIGCHRSKPARTRNRRFRTPAASRAPCR